MTAPGTPHVFRTDSQRGRNIFSLNGIWAIAPTRDAGPPRDYPHTISVPSVVDCADPHYDWQGASFHWYRTTFRLDNPKRGSVFLRIGQSQFGTDVWVNDTHAGRSISCYTSQEYEVGRYLRLNEENEIVIRVGTKENLPPESAVGKDQEKTIYTPGIWGDVALVVSGNPRLSSIQMIPDIRQGVAGTRMVVENRQATPCTVTVTAQALEKKGAKPASAPVQATCTVPGLGSFEVSVTVPIADAHLWSPDSPFLYEMLTSVHAGSEVCDEVTTTFGMREFRIEGKSFVLNGEKVVLKGGNIAFHRFLADKEHALLPWDRSWIKRVLIEIPKNHNFNFFRNHLGQLYPLWYDIADEEGILLQNEWHFWGTTGSKGQIRAELRDWLRDNWNHPSIVIWDPLNESTDAFVQEELVPELRQLDPTRPWESVDFVEEHPYIYSLGPLINDRQFGFTRAMTEIEYSQRPVMFNEFLWWWVDSTGKATALMGGVAERWLGPRWTPQLLLERQSYLARELIELFRRLDVNAIQPFVYLSNNDGPTAHWFAGPIAELRPKPLLAAIKEAFSPVGLSVELWDRHFAEGEKRTVQLYLFNDTSRKESVLLEWGFKNAGAKLLEPRTKDVSMEAHEHKVVTIHPVFPKKSGMYTLHAEIHSRSGVVTSAKPIHVYGKIKTPKGLRISTLGLSEETRVFLASNGIECRVFQQAGNECRVLVVGEGQARGESFESIRSDFDRFVRNGGRLVLLEPEYGLTGKDAITIGDTVIELTRREDKDKGGYDSYVFMDDVSHPVWKGISQDHLFLFNGGIGGEIVSQHDVTISSSHVVLARCGLNLGVVALAEASMGKGMVLISRLQTRGRLTGNGTPGSLYDRRTDPVAQQYLMNLLSYASGEYEG